MKALRWALPLLLLANVAFGHSLSVAHVDVTVAADGRSAELDLDIALRDIALTLPLDRNRDERVTWGELLATQDALEAWVVDGIRVSDRLGSCQLQPTALASRRYDDGAYASLKLTATCASGADLGLDYRLLFPGDPQHRALITVRQAGVLSTHIARAESHRVTLGAAAGNTFVDFLREGVHHILIGYDHLAFLISLLLPAALVWSGLRWQPADSARRTLGHVFGIVSAFTVAHSVTLSLAALGWVTPASRLVEAAIAASVILAALNNVWPVVRRRLWLVAFGFGLIHGFGFAGALGELGLPANAKLLALLGFNLGVEAGQLMVVAIVLPVLFVLRGKPWYVARVMIPVSLLIAALAAYWLFERLAG